MNSPSGIDKVTRPILVGLAIVQVVGAGLLALLATAITYCGLHFDGGSGCDQNSQALVVGGVSLAIVSFLAWFSVAVYRYRLARGVFALELVAVGGLSVCSHVQEATSWGAPVVSSSDLVPTLMILFGAVALAAQLVPKRAVLPSPAPIAPISGSLGS